MKSKSSVLCFLLCVSSSWVCAQDYSIDWSTIDSGGGRSTGGVFTIRGTVGQPDAGGMSSATFSITGGFWSVITVVQTPEAPALTMFRTTTNTALVTWPSPSTGWTLQQNTNSVSSLNWSNVTGIEDNGAMKSLLVNPAIGNRFFRLTR